MSELAIVCAILVIPLAMTANRIGVPEKTHEDFAALAWLFLFAALGLGIAGAVR